MTTPENAAKLVVFGSALPGRSGSGRKSRLRSSREFKEANPSGLRRCKATRCALRAVDSSPAFKSQKSEFHNVRQASSHRHQKNAGKKRPGFSGGSAPGPGARRWPSLFCLFLFGEMHSRHRTTAAAHVLPRGTKGPTMYSNEAPAIEETTKPGECFCHLSLHCSHPFTCDVCTAEVRDEFIAWCEADDFAEQLRQAEIEISPLDIIEMEEWLRDAARHEWERPCAPRTSMERLSA